jgi:hypothetical protein
MTVSQGVMPRDLGPLSSDLAAEKVRSEALGAVVLGSLSSGVAARATCPVVVVRAGFLLHEAVTANVRARVSSGASTLSWLTFLPVSILFGWLSRAHGVQTAGWLLVLITAAGAVLLIRAAHSPREVVPRVPEVEAASPSASQRSIPSGRPLTG